MIMNKYYIKELLKNLCCSDCGADFCQSDNFAEGASQSAKADCDTRLSQNCQDSAGVNGEAIARTFIGKNQKTDFDQFKVLRQEKNILVINLICPKCGKNFGTCILSMCDSDSGDISPLVLQDGPDLITVDEVIDANILIKNLKSDWSKQIPRH